MQRIRSDNQNTHEEWDAIYGSTNAARWTIWHDPQLVREFARRIPADASVLDCGCGNGWAPEYISRQRPDIVWSASDFSPAAVKFLGTLGIRWKYRFPMDLNKLPLWLASDRFDAVMCTEVLEHLEDPQATVKELLRAARKMVAVTVPRENATDTKYHIWSLDENDLRKWFAGCRIEIVPARANQILCCFAWKAE